MTLSAHITKVIKITGKRPKIYDEMNGDIWPVVELHRRIMSEGLSPLQVGRILKRTVALETYKQRSRT